MFRDVYVNSPEDKSYTSSRNETFYAKTAADGTCIPVESVIDYSTTCMCTQHTNIQKQVFRNMCAHVCSSDLADAPMSAQNIKKYEVREKIQPDEEQLLAVPENIC